MVKWDDIIAIVDEAIKRFLTIRKEPIKFLSGNLATSGEKKYYVYFEDTKLTQFYKSIESNRHGVFNVVIIDEFLNPSTSGIDLIAKIPSSMEIEKRAVLRVAWCILVNWQRAVLEAYKSAEPDTNKFTYANAMNWYKELD